MIEAGPGHPENVPGNRLSGLPTETFACAPWSKTNETGHGAQRDDNEAARISVSGRRKNWRRIFPPWPPEDRPRDPRPAARRKLFHRWHGGCRLPPMYLPTVDSGTKSLSHEPGGGEPGSGAVLQQAGHDRAMDQGRKSQTHKSIYRLSPPPKVRTERNLQNSRLDPDETGSPVDLAYQIAAKCAFFTRGRRESRKLKTPWRMTESGANHSLRGIPCYTEENNEISEIWRCQSMGLYKRHSTCKG